MRFNLIYYEIIEIYRVILEDNCIWVVVILIYTQGHLLIYHFLKSDFGNSLLQGDYFSSKMHVIFVKLVVYFEKYIGSGLRFVQELSSDFFTILFKIKFNVRKDLFSFFRQ